MFVVRDCCGESCRKRPPPSASGLANLLLLESFEKDGERQVDELVVELGARFILSLLFKFGESEASLLSRGTLRANVAVVGQLGSRLDSVVVEGCSRCESNFTVSSFSTRTEEIPPPFDTGCSCRRCEGTASLKDVGRSRFSLNLFKCSVNLSKVPGGVLDFSRKRVVSERHS